VIPNIGAFGIRREKLSIPRRRNASIAINVARAEFQIQLLPLAATLCVFATVAVTGSGWLLSSNKILPMLDALGRPILAAAAF